MTNECKADIVRERFMSSHGNVVKSLKSFDPQIIEQSENWIRDEGGGGETCAFSNGKCLEKGGINFSDVYGNNLPPSALKDRPELTGSAFRAMGVSVVFHPINPNVPTAHANIRFFTTSDSHGNEVWWFGGGFDLTPYYPILEDVIFWHEKAKELCDAYDKSLYPSFKEQCDKYFYLPHRKETRGVGGIFFDDFALADFETSLEFCEGVMSVFASSFFKLFEKRKEISFTEEQHAFQSYRRGRYAEFNLVYDRGTHFGLQSGGRTESILMSMPPVAKWIYDWKPKPGSKEENLYENFLKPRDWLNLHK